jgi:hypothetical protein
MAKLAALTGALLTATFIGCGGRTADRQVGGKTRPITPKAVETAVRALVEDGLPRPIADPEPIERVSEEVMRSARISDVVLRFRVVESGDVGTCEVLSPGLAPPQQDRLCAAIKKRRYRPGRPFEGSITSHRALH